jgi:chromosome segregation ATPase
MDDQVKIAVLEQKIEDLKPIVLRIDAAIEKLSEVNTTVSRMLAIHEERISKQEEVDKVLFIKIDKLRDKIDRDYDRFDQRLRQLEKRVWMAIGAVVVASFVMNNAGILTKVLTAPESQIKITSSYVEG